MYLDYTGASLYSTSQVGRHAGLLASRVFGNPHSASPASTEMTALVERSRRAVLAWFKANQPREFTDCTEKAVRWIGTQRGGYGGFGSTQSTILALKALIAQR